MYRVYVKGLDLKDVKKIANGWQLYLETEDIDHADEVMDYLMNGHDVIRLDPGETEDEIDWYGMDDYSSNMPCDNTGFCAGSSCSRFYKCMGYV